MLEETVHRNRDPRIRPCAGKTIFQECRALTETTKMEILGGLGSTAADIIICRDGDEENLYPRFRRLGTGICSVLYFSEGQSIDLVDSDSSHEPSEQSVWDQYFARHSIAMSCRRQRSSWINRGSLGRARRSHLILCLRMVCVPRRLQTRQTRHPISGMHDARHQEGLECWGDRRMTIQKKTRELRIAGRTGFPD